MSPTRCGPMHSLHKHAATQTGRYTPLHIYALPKGEGRGRNGLTAVKQHPLAMFLATRQP